MPISSPAERRTRIPSPDPGVPDTRSPARYLRWLLAQHRGTVAFAALFGVLCTLAQALVPAAVGAGIDRGLLPRDRGALVFWGVVVLALGVIQAITGMLRDRCSTVNRFGVSYRTTQLVTRKATELGAELPLRVSSGEVVGVSAMDVGRLGSALESTARGGGAVVSILFVAGFMLTTAWQLGLVVLVGVPLVAGAVTLLMRLLHDRQQRLRERQGVLADLALDIVDGLRVLRGIGGEGVYGRRYQDASQTVRREGMRVASVEANVALGRVLLPGLLVTAIVWLGAHHVRAGRIEAGVLVAFYGYAVFLAEQLRQLTGMLDQLTRASVAASRVIGFLRLTPTRPPGRGGGTDLSPLAELHDPDSGLRIPPGRLVGVVCAGVGDARRIADRLGCYTESRVSWGGTPLGDLPRDEIRRHVLVVDNDAVFFAGVLATELDPSWDVTPNATPTATPTAAPSAAPTAAPTAAPGQAADPDPAALHRCLHSASAQDVVEARPDGLHETIIGGREFSGGEQQRLRLTRALMADPEVLVLVEPTNALDAHTEGRVAERLRAHRQGRRTVVFTSSPILLDHTDQVVLVEDGTVVAEGEHGTLLADARYRAVVTREVVA